MNYLDIAIKAAKKAGQIHLKHFQGDIKLQEKTSSFDLLTIADLEAEREVVNCIKEHYPDHNFLAEENKYDKTDSEHTWIIDPLDGTNNFSSGLPIFCCSIALAKGDDLLLGVVYDPNRDELFFAEKSKGAFLNTDKLEVNKKNTLKGSLLITGFYYDRNKEMKSTLLNIEKFFKKSILGLRRLGAAALDLSYVASGRVSGFWEFKLSPWDFAAGKIIIEEAGGTVTDNKGKAFSIYKPSYIVSSNSKIHTQLLEVLQT
tara:strand:- start:271 stop:1047 length:777 start_codon:yes stop_codon:yes gene_type:complete